MWSPELILRRLVLPLGLPLFLGGCFQPLYGGSKGVALQSDLAAVTVDPVPDRLGHYLRDDLIYALNGTGSHVPSKYRLSVILREHVQTPLVDTLTAQATSATVAVDADYRLVPMAGGAPITAGTAFTAASYDRTGNRFADTRAARDAEIRDAKALAEQIRMRLAIAVRK